MGALLQHRGQQGKEAGLQTLGPKREVPAPSRVTASPLLLSGAGGG